jgi:hypothetical protein
VIVAGLRRGVVALAMNGFAGGFGVNDEVQTCRGLLHDCILVKRRTLCERLLGQLGGKERNG